MFVFCENVNAINSTMITIQGIFKVRGIPFKWQSLVSVAYHWTSSLQNQATEWTVLPVVYLGFCLVRVLSTYSCSSKCKGLSTAWGLGPRWTSLHIALSAPVRGQGSDAMRVMGERRSSRQETAVHPNSTLITDNTMLRLLQISVLIIYTDGICSYTNMSILSTELLPIDSTMSAISPQTNITKFFTRCETSQESHLLFRVRSSRRFEKNWMVDPLLQNPRQSGGNCRKFHERAVPVKNMCLKRSCFTYPSGHDPLQPALSCDSRTRCRVLPLWATFS